MLPGFQRQSQYRGGEAALVAEPMNRNADWQQVNPFYNISNDSRLRLRIGFGNANPTS